MRYASIGWEDNKNLNVHCRHYFDRPDKGLNPQPSRQPSTLNPHPLTLNPQPSTLNPQPSTLNPEGLKTSFRIRELDAPQKELDMFFRQSLPDERKLRDCKNLADEAAQQKSTSISRSRSSTPRGFNCFFVVSCSFFLVNISYNNNNNNFTITITITITRFRF